MSLRLKIILILLLIFFLFLCVNQLVEYKIIAPSFQALEEAEARKDMQRSIEALKSEIQHLDGLVSEWADWTDSYEFTENKNEDYIEDNLLDETFVSEEVNLFCIFNKEKQLVFGILRDPETDIVSDIDEKSLNHLYQKKLVLDNSNEDPLYGVIIFNDKPILVASRAIYTTNLKGPMHGCFILGKELNEEYIKLISDQTKVNLQLWPVNDPSIPEDDAKYTSNPIDELVIFKSKEDEDRLYVYSVFPNINNAPALLLKAEIPRDITANSSKTLRFAIFSFLGSGAVILLIIMLLIQLTVINPISRLTSHVMKIGKTDDLSSRLDGFGKDEVGQLSVEFNKMIEKLSEARQKLMEQSFNSGMAELAKGVLHNIGNAINPLRLYIEEIQQNTGFKNHDKFKATVNELVEDNPTDERKTDLMKYLQLSVDRLIDSAHKLQRPTEGILKQITIVEDILKDQESLSRAERTMETLELSKLLNDSLSLIPTTARDSLLVETDESVSRYSQIRGPRIALMQVFANLLNNAAEAKKTGNAKNLVKISANKDSFDGIDMIVISFKDEGIGINKENQQKIFEQGFSTKNKSFSGLGLHWCANTLNSIGGSISVESDGSAKGACFQIRIPIIIQ